MFNSRYFRIKTHFKDLGTQNCLVFQPVLRYFKQIADNNNISSWKSKELSDESINPKQDGGWQKRPPYQLFPLQHLQTYKLTPKIFWLLVLILFQHWCKISTPYVVTFPNYWTWTKSTQKNNCIQSNPYKIV